MSNSSEQKSKIKESLVSFRLSFHHALAKKRSVNLPTFLAQKYLKDDVIQKIVSFIKMLFKGKAWILAAVLSIWNKGVLFVELLVKYKVRILVIILLMIILVFLFTLFFQMREQAEYQIIGSDLAVNEPSVILKNLKTA
ncbi:MAG: hypothetical protein J5781_04205 [Clostridia bacterium]|nr:hypothetical protein [Clostridia bacterium]